MSKAWNLESWRELSRLQGKLEARGLSMRCKMDTTGTSQLTKMKIFMQ